MSPAWDILNACVQQARDEIDLTGEDGTPGIISERVIAATVPYARDRRQLDTVVNRPALIFTPPRTVETPSSAGTNRTGVALYTVVAQIVHTDFSLVSGPVLKNVLKWEYNVRRYFHMGNLRQGVWTERGFMSLAASQKVDVLNEKLFYLWDDAVAVVPITFKVTEPHDARGRT